MEYVTACRDCCVYICSQGLMHALGDASVRYLSVLKSTLTYVETCDVRESERVELQLSHDMSVHNSTTWRTPLHRHYDVDKYRTDLTQPGSLAFVNVSFNIAHQVCGQLHASIYHSLMRLCFRWPSWRRTLLMSLEGCCSPLKPPVTVHPHSYRIG